MLIYSDRPFVRAGIADVFENLPEPINYVEFSGAARHTNCLR